MDAEERLAYMLFIAIGVGYLFPFSALTQPVDYWNELFPDFNIEFAITNTYMWVNLSVIALFVFVGGEPVFRKRIYGGFAGQLFVLILVPTTWFCHFSENVNFWIIIVSTTIAAVVTALIDSCAIAFSAQYPQSIQAGFQLGIGVSTLIGSVYRIFTKLVFPDRMVVASSLLYFYCGAGTIVFCMYAYYLLLQLDLSKRHVRFGLSPASRSALTTSPPPSNQMTHLLTSPVRTHHTYQAIEEGNSTFDSPSKIPPSSVNSEDEEEGFAHRYHVFCTVLPALAVVFNIFFTTLAVWPALTTEVPSYNFPYLQETRWWSLILLFLFAAMDCTGRLLVEYRWIITKDNIWVFAVLRTLFIPLLICSVKGWIFTNDIWSVLFISILGYTNGYLGSLSILLVNDWVDPRYTGLAGTFTGFTLNSGLVVGATASVFLDKFVQSL